MTSIVVASGYAWSKNALLDVWGDVLDHEWELAILVEGRFERLANAAGYPVSWFPSLSEVHSDVNLDLGDEPENPLDVIREEAMADVWRAVVDEDGPMAGQVATIFAS